MNHLTPFQILIAFQMLNHGTTQRTCSTGDVIRQSYECKMELEKGREVRCKSNGFHYDSVRYFYYYWILINEPNETPSNDSRSTAFSLNDVQREMFAESSNFYRCQDDTGNLVDILDQRLQELLAKQQFQSQCQSNHDCLVVVPTVLANIKLKSLKITQIGEINLKNTTFRSYPNLTVLSLRESDVYLDPDAFYGLSSLRKLTLSGDNITDLPHYVFGGLEQLTELDVSRNRLTEISRELFIPLLSLVFLDLSHNEIRTLTDDVFSTLQALQVLSLSSNQLKTLPATIFRETNSLTDVDLSGNGITEFPKELLWNLHLLEVLNMSRCELQSLDTDLFGKNFNLKVLNLSHNELTVLPDDTFPVQFNLEVLDISHNHLHWWSAKTLNNVSSLNTLLLNGNRLVSLPTNMLAGTRDLKILDIAENKLQGFSGELIKLLRGMNLLNASRNSIRYVELGLYNTVFSRTLDFSRNEIEALDIRWERLISLENVDFDWNNLTSLELPACLTTSRAIVISFRRNNILHVEISYPTHGLPHARTCSGPPENTLFLDGNPFDCDCKLYSFYKQVTKQGGVIPYKFPDSDTWKCKEPFYLKGSHFESLNKYMFLCPVTDCSEPCFCGVRATDNRTIVNCTGKNLEAVPESAPKNVSILYFRGNKLKNLNLRKVDWENLTELYLENNLLENLEATDIPEGLRVLSLSGNRLQNVSMSLRNFVSIHDNVRLRLGNNSWNCTCSLKSLKEWLLKHKQNVDDLNDVTCEIMENGESRTIALYKIPDKLLCPEELSRAVQVAIVAGTVSTSVLVIAGLLLLLLYYKNAETVHAFMYGTSLFQCFFHEDPEEEEEKLFDAFVAYSSKDAEVTMKLVEVLEGESPFFKLCIHERDWIPGHFISENIVSSVQNSRRVILILSDDFVSSVWFAVEARAVLFQMLQDRVNRLLVVVVGSFPSLDEIENDIRQLLLRRTYLVWGERWFWEKMRYALPHKGRSKISGTEAQGRKFNLLSLVEKEVSVALNEEGKSEENA